MNQGLKAAVDEAKVKVQELCGSLSVCAARYEGYGSDLVKSKGLKADPLMQLALQVHPPTLSVRDDMSLPLQVTYYRLYGELVPSYESCSTAAFR